MINLPNIKLESVCIFLLGLTEEQRSSYDKLLGIDSTPNSLALPLFLYDCNMLGFFKIKHSYKL